MQFIRKILIISGVIFWLLIIIGAYIYFGAPLPESAETFVAPVKENVVEQVENAAESIGVPANDPVPATSASSDAAAPVSTGQASALRAFGIDPSAVNDVTPEQEACFVRTLGSERVEAVKAGAIPTPSDLIKARECL